MYPLIVPDVGGEHWKFQLLIINKVQLIKIIKFLSWVKFHRRCFLFDAPEVS